MYNLNKKSKIIIITIIIILISIVSYFIYTNTEETDIISYNEVLNTNNVIETKEESTKKDDDNKIVIHVAGAVANPGIVELQENTRVSDAIEKAGGLSDDADISKINLAYLLEDGMKIYIPTHTEVEEEKEMTCDSNNYVTSDSGVQEITTNNKVKSNSSANTKVNINTATQSDFETLPGIGTATALKIINYRNENGKFKSVEDIKNVKGIGESKFEKIKEFIFVK